MSKSNVTDDRGRRRVVVTGVGLLTPIGNDNESSFAAMLEGRSGAAPIQGFDASEYATTFAHEVKDLDPSRYLDRRTLKRMDPYTVYALVSTHEAVRCAGLEIDKEDPTRIGMVQGTGIAGITTLEDQKVQLMKRGARGVSPLLVPKMMFNAHTGQVALELGFKGPNFAVGSACASASHAIGVALRMVQYGDADIMVTGGAECATTALGFLGFSNMKALSRRNDDPQRASRPFDKERDGFVMGEGAGALILEERERALARGAKIYAELVGFGASDDAFHLTAPDETGDGPCRAMEMALKDAGIRPEQVDYVNAHGTSTPLNDKTETKAIRRLFGEHADKLAVSSTKSMVGHLLGASGGVELGATCLMMDRGVITPTINYENPDPECDLDYVPNEAREMRFDYAISNSFGFGGTNCCLALARNGVR
ncbi:MAG: beta-ketoacyl-[acyl-carrier-protein] synthase II [Planctomycetota bacterium]|nr:MAG: beta-ketoacyl-[acyl-carrier-protein] synthase II [Planctomycetota bacterium]